MNNIYTRQRLKQLQEMPLIEKIHMSTNRLMDFVEYFGGPQNCFVSFSGGKDSRVMLDIARYVYPEIKGVFCDTGLEYPEIRQFVKSIPNIDIVKPKENFVEVLTKRGYPLISKQVAECIYYARKNDGKKTPPRKRSELLCQMGNKNSTQQSVVAGTQNVRRQILLGQWETRDGTGATKRSQFNKEKWLPLCRDLPIKISHECCNVMKKSPVGMYQRKHKMKPILGTMACESRLRAQAWYRNGCNAFDSKDQKSQPMSFWTQQDVLKYIKRYDIDICQVYGDIVCLDKKRQIVTCDEQIPDGCHLECEGCSRTGCLYCAFGFHNEKKNELTRFQRLAKTHPQQYEYCMRGGNGLIILTTILSTMENLISMGGCVGILKRSSSLMAVQD